MDNKNQGKTCSFCQFPIKQDSEVVVCSACKIPHHRECWQENGGCTTFGHQGFNRAEPGSESKAGEALDITLEEPSDQRVRVPMSEKTGRLLVGFIAGGVILLGVLIFIVVDALYINGPASTVEVRLTDPVQEEPAIDPAIAAGLDADYYIDYENGTIPIGGLPIGARVVDPSWEWEFRTGRGYAREAGDETKPVT